LTPCWAAISKYGWLSPSEADFLNHCLAFPELKNLLQDKQLLLGPLDQSVLRDVIVRPAQHVGAFFEKGLVQTILRDIEDNPGSLPLLQHALYELWRARRGPWLTMDEPPVNTVFMPDGHKGLSSAGDGTLVIWDLVNAGEIRRFDGHSTEVPVVAFTPDGKYILTGAGRLTLVGGPGDDNTMKMWEVETGKLVRVFEGHTDSLMAIAVSADGRRALTGGGFDGSMKLWDLNTGDLIRSIDAHKTGVFALAFSPDGQRALSGPTGAEAVILWDLENGDTIHQFPNVGENSTELIFHPDGHSAYSAYFDLMSLDLESGEISHQYQTGNCCTGFAIHPDWKSIFTVSGGDRITQWDLERDELIREFGDHNGTRSRLEISPDGDLLLSSDSTGQLYLWDPKTGNEIRRFRTDTSVYLFDIDISPDGRSAITPADSGSAILWDLTLPTGINDVLDWISDNRYVRELTCEERTRYSIEPLCETETP
jgi:WD40 repeat protein